MVFRTLFGRIVLDMGEVVLFTLKMVSNFFEGSDLDSDLESVSIELKINYSKPLQYINRRVRSKFMKKIESLICKIDCEEKKCILTGDMIFNMLNPQDNNTRHIKRIYYTYEFKQIIKKLPGLLLIQKF